MFFLDKDKSLRQYKLHHMGPYLSKLTKIACIDSLNWEDIHSKCKPIGRGYWTDVFYHS